MQSFNEYVYDKDNFSDYKEIREYKSNGINLDTIEFFYYSKEEAETCPLGETIKNSLKADFEKFSYDKNKELGKNVSILCSVEEGGKYKPLEKSYYTKVKSGDYSSLLAVTYDYDEYGSLEDHPCDIIFDGFVDSVGETTIEYKGTPSSSNQTQYKNVRLCFSPETGNSVSYYRVIEIDITKITNVPFIETEYWTHGLTCTTSNINAYTDLTENITFTLNKSPKFSYRDIIPDDKCDGTRWYQVNRTINFFETSSDNITNTMYTLYKMSWDEEIYTDSFILQTEYNTNKDFTEIGSRIKTVSVIPESKDKQRAYLFIYGETTQSKTSFSYAPYPKISDTNGNPKAEEYNTQAEGNFYECKESYFKRKSDESLDLFEESYSKRYLYFQDGYLIEQIAEFDSGSSDANATSDSSNGSTDMNESADRVTRKMVLY